MEVILKKTKITSAVFKQTLTANSFDFETFEVLGFCVINNQKWILMYKSSTKELRKYLMFTDLKNEVNNSDLRYTVKVIFDNNYVPKTYATKDENESLDFIKTLNTVKHKAVTHGQIFL
jgi:hypothetical protein